METTNNNADLLKKYHDYLSKAEKIRRLCERPGTPDEGKQAKLALKKIEEKIANMEKMYGFSQETAHTKSNNYSAQNYSAGFYDGSYDFTSGNNSWADHLNETEDEKYSRLGIIYAIFGNSFKINLYGFKYEVRFKKLEPDDSGFAFCRVLCDIVEDNQVIASDVVIGFWPWSFGDLECGHMEISSYHFNSIRKYKTDCTRYNEIMHYMMLKWNNYFGNERRYLLQDSQNYLGDGEIDSIVPADYSRNRSFY